MRRERDFRQEPKFTGTTIKDHLIFLRDTFSDEVPSHIVHSNDADNRYKVRINWWQGLTANFENSLTDDTVDSSLKPEIEAFVDNFLSTYVPEQLITYEQIQSANALINKVVADVDSDPMLWTSDRLYKINWA